MPAVAEKPKRQTLDRVAKKHVANDFHHVKAVAANTLPGYKGGKIVRPGLELQEPEVVKLNGEDYAVQYFYRDDDMLTAIVVRFWSLVRMGHWRAVVVEPNEPIYLILQEAGLAICYPECKYHRWLRKKIDECGDQWAKDIITRRQS